jgi:hypothetical protein
MQDLQNPLGVGGPELFQWFFNSRVWRRMHGLEGGETGIDNQMAERGFEGVGAWILGRNMFGPVRGPWPDESWKGWWGEEPPYHTPVFVLTHHARPALRMAGGTEFHFVTEGIRRRRAGVERPRSASIGLPGLRSDCRRARHSHHRGPAPISEASARSIRLRMADLVLARTPVRPQWRAGRTRWLCRESAVHLRSGSAGRRQDRYGS